MIDKLHAGSGINYRAVFLNDTMHVNIKALTDVKMLYISVADLLTLVNKFGGGGRDKGPDQKKAWVQNFSNRVLFA